MEFVSEKLVPHGDEFALAPVIGEPALPLRFSWRRKIHEVKQVRRRWKGVSPDRTHGGDEQYLHRHWYELEMADGTCWTVYFLRQPSSARAAKARWWLYGVSTEVT